MAKVQKDSSPKSEPVAKKALKNTGAADVNVKEELLEKDELAEFKAAKKQKRKKVSRE